MKGMQTYMGDSASIPSVLVLGNELIALTISLDKGVHNHAIGLWSRITLVGYVSQN